MNRYLPKIAQSSDGFEKRLLIGIYSNLSDELNRHNVSQNKNNKKR